MPHFFGSPLSRDYWGPVAAANINEIALSVGLVPWIALPLALVLTQARPGTKYFAALAASAAAHPYGPPLCGDLHGRLPLFPTTPIGRAAHLPVVPLPVPGSHG